MTTQKERIYVVKVSNDDDYFIVLAETKDDAVEKLQEYWRPCNDGLGKIWECVSEGYPIECLREGRHFAWFKNIAIGDTNDDTRKYLIEEEEMGQKFRQNEFIRKERIKEEIEYLFKTQKTSR